MRCSKLTSRYFLAVLGAVAFLTPHAAAAGQLVADGINLDADPYTLYDTSPAGGTAGYAFWALNSGSIVSLGVVELVTSGLGANGAVAESGGTITIDWPGSTIVTTGNSATGALANGVGTSITLDGVGITTSGGSAEGVFADDDGMVSVANSSIMTTGSVANGAVASDGGSIEITASSVATTGDDSYGLRASGNSTIDVSGGSTITTSGANAHGAAAQINGAINLDGSSITTTGENAYGADILDDSSIELRNGSSITTSGSGSHAVWLGQGELSATNSEITAQGAGAYGVVVGPGGSAANLTNSSLVSMQSAALKVNSTGTLAVTLQGATVSGRELLNVDTDAELNIFAANSTLTGAATTAPDGTAQLNLLGTSTWNITGDSNLTLLIVQSGATAQFTSPGSGSFKTLTVQDYVGIGGTLGINTHLGSDGSPSDQLIIDGGNGLGSSLLSVRNFHGAGDLTTADGILVVDTINGGTTVPGMLALAAPVIAGPYEYSLYRGGENGDNPNNWYLRSDLDCALDPSAPVCGNDIPDWRQEVSLYAAIPAMTLLYGRLMLDTLHERRGDAMGGTAAGYPDAAWGRVIGQHGDRDGASDGVYGAGPKYDYDFWAFQGGADLYRDGDAGSSRNRAGAFFAIGNGSGDVDNFDHVKAGENSFMAYSWGGYWTHYTPDNAYIDALLLGTWYDIDAKSTRIPKMKTHGAGFGASIEGGYPFAFAGGFRIEPQAQLAYQTINLDSASDIAADVQFSDVNSLAGRLGVRFAQDFGAPSWLTGGPGTFTAWIRPNFWYEFLGDPKTSFSSETGFIPFAAKIGGTTFEINTGFSTQVAEGTSLYANASYLVGISENADGNAYDGKLGVKVAW